MGLGVGRRLLERGFRVFGRDAFPANAEKARQAGLEMRNSLAEVAGDAARIILFLPGPAEIRACVTGADGLLAHLPKGGAILDMSTSSPDNTVAMAAAAGAAGVGYLDVPVLGRPSTIGNWCLLAGGDAGVLEQCRDFLEPLAGKIIHVGGPGTGHAVKLLNQLMFGAINAMTAEMMAVAEKIGVPPARVHEIIAGSQASTVSGIFRELGARIGEERYGDPTFTVAMLAKDIRLAVEMAEKAGCAPIVGRAVDLLNRFALIRGKGGYDTAILWEGVREMWRDDGTET
jgi:3-hydroxyisobutyrate dehydrogenase-like beta-hydroxyacid dehydrogenase